MTPDERTLLQTFLSDLTTSRAGQKDGEADRMISDALRSSPDAAYLLVQHAIISDQALHAAKDQIAQLQAQLRSLPAPAPAPQPSRFFGGQSQGPSPWAQAAAVPPPQDQYPYQPPQQSGGFFGPGPFNRGGGLGSFLRTAGTTAAGVAGGALLFDGISNLFGGHREGFGGFGGGGFGGGFGGGQPEEIIENNYYGSDQGGGGFGGGDSGWDTGGGGDDSGSFDT
jgi:hypothetical protein